MSALTARFRGSIGALRLDAALRARAGEVTALVGPSGTGKTTLLRAIAGLERLAGEVKLGETVWQDAATFVPSHRRAVGFVFQQGGLLPHLTVRGNLEFGGRRARISSAIMEQAIALMRIEPLLARRPDRLSGGERKRVALARALSTSPRLLLLDEPFAGLDDAAKAELMPGLMNMTTTLAFPVILVSHDLAEVARLSRTILRLENGRISSRDQAAQVANS